MAQDIRYCSAKAACGIYEPACQECRHNACGYYQQAKRDEMDAEQDWEDRNE